MAGARPVPTEPAQARWARAGDKDNRYEKRKRKKEINRTTGERSAQGPLKKKRAVSLLVWNATAEK